MCHQTDALRQRLALTACPVRIVPMSSFFPVSPSRQNGGLTLRKCVPAGIMRRNICRGRCQTLAGWQEPDASATNPTTSILLFFTAVLGPGEVEESGRKPGFGVRWGFVSQTSRNSLGASGQISSPLNLCSLKRKAEITAPHSRSCCKSYWRQFIFSWGLSMHLDTRVGCLGDKSCGRVHKER